MPDMLTLDDILELAATFFEDEEIMENVRNVLENLREKRE